MSLKPLLSIGLISLIVSACGLLARYSGGLESWELNAFDQMIRLRPEEPIKERLLIVKITEADIQTQKQWPLSDGILYQLLSKLEQYQPLIIGLDIYRDLPVEPGHQQFINKLQTSDRIVPICKVSDYDSPGVKPPEGIDHEKAGFADIVVDPGGIVRRGLIFIEPGDDSRCQTPYSLSFQLARRYLKTKNIVPQLTADEQLQFGATIFKRLLPNGGSYQKVDHLGYQILLNYHSALTQIRSLTLEDVLQERLDPSWVKNKIVLIGVTASSIDDAFYTPYSASQIHTQKMPGVIVHAQLTNQIITAALGERPLFWFWPDWGEALWIWGWSLTGGLIAYFVRHPVHLFLAEGVAWSLLLGCSWIVFLQAGWLPVVPSSLTLMGSSILIVAYSAYQNQQERQKISLQVQEQTRDIALLQALIKEKRDSLATTSVEHLLPTEIPPEAEITTAIAIENQPSKSHFTELLAGRYRVNRVIGSGGFAYTYVAEDTQRPGLPQCLVKHLQPARRDDTFLQIARRLFNTEAQILEKLGNHTQIPQLLAHFEENQEFYLVEEYIPGQSLSEELNSDQRQPEEKVIPLLKEILSILVYIHKHGVIHRDIKPSNIIRSSENSRLVLIDFGAVKQIQPQNENSKQGLTIAIGTRGYTPPEQYAGQPNFSSDIYALGIIGIQALTGISPEQFSVDKKSGELHWRPLASTSEELAVVIDKMVRYHFKERYESAALALTDLENIS